MLYLQVGAILHAPRGSVTKRMLDFATPRPLYKSTKAIYKVTRLGLVCLKARSNIIASFLIIKVGVLDEAPVLDVVHGAGCQVQREAVRATQLIPIWTVRPPMPWYSA